MPSSSTMNRENGSKIPNMVDKKKAFVSRKNATETGLNIRKYSTYLIVGPKIEWTSQLTKSTDLRLRLPSFWFSFHDNFHLMLKATWLF